MSTVILKTIVVHDIAWEEEKGKAPPVQQHHDKAVEIFGAGMVTPIMRHPANGKSSFMVIPDGRSVGWPTHQGVDNQRARFREYLHSQKTVEWYEIHGGEARPFISDGS